MLFDDDEAIPPAEEIRRGCTVVASRSLHFNHPCQDSLDFNLT
jgi:hypothetical protein